MSSVLDDREAYSRSPYFTKHIYGDYTPFYITVTICTVFFLFLIILNVTIGCCSRYSTYWGDRHTGNRWIIPLWTATPHNQPALDYKELEDYHPTTYYVEREPEPDPRPIPHSKSSEYLELQQQKRESAI